MKILTKLNGAATVAHTPANFVLILFRVIRVFRGQKIRTDEKLYVTRVAFAVDKDISKMRVYQFGK